MLTIRHITAAEVRNQQREREREREIKREREREGKELQPKEKYLVWLDLKLQLLVF